MLMPSFTRGSSQGAARVSGSVRPATHARDHHTMPEARLHIPSAPFAAVSALAAELGCSEALAQVLVRRGLDPTEARRFLAADERHPVEAFGGPQGGAGAIRPH